jgi:hypothetical protein
MSWEFASQNVKLDFSSRYLLIEQMTTRAFADGRTRAEVDQNVLVDLLLETES